MTSIAKAYKSKHKIRPKWTSIGLVVDKSKKVINTKKAKKWSNLSKWGTSILDVEKGIIAR